MTAVTEGSASLEKERTCKLKITSSFRSIFDTSRLVLSLSCSRSETLHVRTSAWSVVRGEGRRAGRGRAVTVAGCSASDLPALCTGRREDALKSPILHIFNLNQKRSLLSAKVDPRLTLVLKRLKETEDQLLN